MSENTLQIFQLILKIFSEFFELWGNIQLWWSCFITGWMLCICIIFSLIAVWELVHLKLWSDAFRAFKAQDIFNLQDMFHLQLFSIFSAPLLCQSYRSIAMSDLRFQIKCRFLDSMRIYKSLVRNALEGNWWANKFLLHLVWKHWDLLPLNCSINIYWEGLESSKLI